MKTIIYILKNIFLRKSLNRTFQELYAMQFVLKGKNIIEFGATKNSSKNFTNFMTIHKEANLIYADKINDNGQLKEDLEKKLSFIDNSFDNVILFNVLEHVYNSDNAISEIYRCLNKTGKLIGATPFIYRLHNAPEDFSRYTDQYILKILENNNFKNISIKIFVFGPFTAAYALIFDYIKYIPIISNFIFAILLLIDLLINFFVKTNLKMIYPLSICFSAEK